MEQPKPRGKELEQPKPYGKELEQPKPRGKELEQPKPRGKELEQPKPRGKELETRMVRQVIKAEVCHVGIQIESRTIPSMENVSPEYDESSPYHSRFEVLDPNEPAASIVRAVSAVTDVRPLELDPLYETIDPDALNRLFDRPENDDSLSLEFEIDDCSVIVTGDGRLSVRHSVA